MAQSLKDKLAGLKPALVALPPQVAPPNPPPPPEPKFAALQPGGRPRKKAKRGAGLAPPPPHWPRHRPTTETHPATVLTPMVGWFEPADALHDFARPSMPRHTLKRLRQGYWPSMASLDLHGLTRFDAQQRLAVFLHHARAVGQCVRVIHGKGMGSQSGQPVLKHMVRTWLRHHPYVLAFCEASDAQGGSGALWVLLSRAGQQVSEEEA